MPSVNWNVFESLAGSAQKNFESLCRSLVRRHYGRYGRFAALANQPGVEFHLKLEASCPLGGPDRWFGWQCRWYDLPSGRALGFTRKKKIKEAIETTERVIPGLTNWVLWTRHSLTKGDQKWFYGLKTKMRLSLYTASDAEDLLNGDCAIFRETYFGELILTPDSLATLHSQQVSRVQKRWMPVVHQSVDAERTIRRMLGEGKPWDHLLEFASKLKAASAALFKGKGDLPQPLVEDVMQFCVAVQSLVTLLFDIRKLIDAGDLDLIQQKLEARPNKLAASINSLPRRMRAARSRLVFIATNAHADILSARCLLDEVAKLLCTRLISVIADAGTGKTQLAAQLTSPSSVRPAGVLLFGQDLHAGHSLDQLVSRIVIPGGRVPIPSMEALIAAVDAAGQRARKRLPIVIDGLNEAEDPRDWKGPLSSIREILGRYPFVIIVCTLRTGARQVPDSQFVGRNIDQNIDRMSFADDALPDDVQRLLIPDYAQDTEAAIKQYFNYYKIDPGDANLPTELLKHPLTLRLFCEVTNPSRSHEVGIEKMPGSLSALFQRYLEQAASRIADLSPRTSRYYSQDVKIAFYEIGMCLWNKRAREMGVSELRTILGDAARPWDQSIVRALEQEGVILRIPTTTPGQYNIMPVYDALAGHMIGEAILSQHGHSGLQQWLGQEETRNAFVGSHADLHPFADDIFCALVGLVPRRFGRQQLWTMIDERLRLSALQEAAELEAEFLDADTISELAKLINQPSSGPSDLLVRLFHTRGSPAHPLNSLFLDSILRPMAIAKRDLRWTEWIRRNRNVLMDDLRILGERWQKDVSRRNSSDTLRARWIMWMLTSTVHELRNYATRALYWFGRGNPAALFELTCDSLDINDPYVSERMLAASYGVTMAWHVDIAYKTFVSTVLSPWARRLYEQMFRRDAPCGTTHMLAREYSRRIIELAVLYKRTLLTPTEKKRIHPPFRDGGLRKWGMDETLVEKRGELVSPFHMDFENYTLGQLVKDRRNYDFQHAGYRKVRANILWRIQQLGWSPEQFGEIDRKISSSGQNSSRMMQGENKTDRYGKKYSWIAFYELAGHLLDQGELEENEYASRWTVDIDPSFPAPRRKGRPISADFLGDHAMSPSQWVCSGPCPDLGPFLKMLQILDEEGPWVALDGFFTQEDPKRGHKMFCFIRSFIVPSTNAKTFCRRLIKQDIGGRWLPEKPSVSGAYAGEIPLCETYPKNGLTEIRFKVGESITKVRRRKPMCFLDGKMIGPSVDGLVRRRAFGKEVLVSESQRNLSDEEIRRIEIRHVIMEEEEVRAKIESYKVLIPIRDYGWQGESVGGATLAKEITTDLGLVGQPQSFDMFTRDGERATLGVADDDQYSNGQHAYFIKEDILKKLLKKRKYSLVWAIWGEREYSTALLSRLIDNGEHPEKPYQSFQVVRPFKR